MGHCTENQIAAALAEAYGVPYAQVSPKLCDPKAVELLPREFLEAHIVLPLFKVHDVLTVAVNEPTNVFLIDEIERISGCRVRVVCSTADTGPRTAVAPAAVFVIDDIIDERGLRNSPSSRASRRTSAISRRWPASHRWSSWSTTCRTTPSVRTPATSTSSATKAARPVSPTASSYEKMRPPHQMHAALPNQDHGRANTRSDVFRRTEYSRSRKPPDRLRVSVMPGNFGEGRHSIIDPQKIPSTT